MKGVLDCSPFNGDACLCFAAGNGEECMFCSSTNKCVSADTALSDCPNDNLAQRKELAASCGKQEINLVKAPASILPGWSGLAWTGEEISFDFHAVFHVTKIAFSNVGEEPVSVTVLPESNQRTPSLSHSCNVSNSCTYILEVPFVSNLTITSISSTQPASLRNLLVSLAPYTPVDGVVSYLEPWSFCSNGCGEGLQYRLIACTPPEYGGLPCADNNGTFFAGNATIVRPCTSVSDCGTNWEVMAVIGWWQLLLVLVFSARKIYGCIKARKDEERDKYRAKRRRFSSDLDDELGLDEVLDVS